MKVQRRWIRRGLWAVFSLQSGLAQAQAPVLDPSQVQAPPAAATAPLPEGLVNAEGPPPLIRMAPPLPTVLGEVTAIDGPLVTISLGAADGVQLGAHVAFFDRVGPNDEWSAREGPTRVGKVINLSSTRARVRLGLLEETRIGEKVQLTRARLSESRVAPPRAAPLLLLKAGLRPFLPLERVSIGAVADFSLTYLPRLPMFVTAELQPLAGRVGVGGDASLGAATLSIGYDQRFVGVGLGAGVTSYRRFIADTEDTWGETQGHLAAGSPRFTFAQQIRAGARDGLHVQLASAFALDGERWRFAWLRVMAQFAVASGAWLSPRFVLAPQVGLFTGELGLRLLARGNGGPGSLFVRPLIGAAGSFASEKNSGLSSGAGPGFEAMTWGPMLGIDLEWRL